MDKVLALADQVVGDQPDRDQVCTEDPIQLLSVKSNKWLPAFFGALDRHCKTAFVIDGIDLADHSVKISVLLL